jgi:serine/threonine protein kinase
MTFRYDVGSRPLPRYIIQRGLGSGGFGEVYFAVSDAGKEVALKFLQHNSDVELRGVSHCLNLKHQNLISLHDICLDENDHSWVVMEYVDGPNLRQVIQDFPTGLPLSEVKHWILGILNGVWHLHQSRIVHRDIKPENIFDDNGIVKIGDYGLSTSMQSGGARQTQGVGTVHYMAPEVGRGEYGPSVDIYAIGILFYELLTGTVPFDGETKNEVLMKHLTTEPQLGQIPDAFRSIIQKCLQKDRNCRYRSVGEIIEQVEAAFCIPCEDMIPVAELVSDVCEKHEVGRNDAIVLGQVNKKKTYQLKSIRSQLGGTSGSVTVLIVFALVCLSVAIAPNPFVFSALVAWYLMASLILFSFWFLRKSTRNSFTTSKLFEDKDKGTQRSILLPYQVNSKKWRLAARHYLRDRSLAGKISEWLYSSCLALPLAFILGAIGFSINQGDSSVDFADTAPFVWTAMVVSAAAIGLFAIGQHWNASSEQDFSQRIFLGCFGGIVGLVAFYFSQYLLLDADYEIVRDIEVTQVSVWLYPENSPTILAYVSHFAGLFFCVRWSQLCDPIRQRRFSLWSVLVTVIVAWCMQQLFPVPRPLGMFFAAGLSVVVQLASPWMPSSMRSNLLETKQHSVHGLSV